MAFGVSPTSVYLLLLVSSDKGLECYSWVMVLLCLYKDVLVEGKETHIYKGIIVWNILVPEERESDVCSFITTK